MLNDGFDILHPIDSSKQIIRDWWAAVIKIRDTKIPDNNPDLVARRDALLNRAYTLREMIKSATTEAFAKEVGLGVAPLVVVGGVALAAVVAYIGKYMTDYSKYMSDMDAAAKAAAFKIQVYNDQVKQGVDSNTAASNADKAASGMYQQNKTDKDFLGVPVKYWLIGGGVLALLFVVSSRRQVQAPTPTFIMGQK